MKGVVLLAVIHIFIIYQSDKKKSKHLNELPDPPEVVVEAKPALLKTQSPTPKPVFTGFMLTNNARGWAGTLRY